MPTLYMYHGLPGSGKTTQAMEEIKNRPELRRVNKDDLRAMYLHTWSQKSEGEIIAIRDEIICKALIAGNSIICDDTNFAPQHEKRLRVLATATKADFEIVDFPTPLEECIARDACRPKPVGEKVIRDMYNKYLVPKGLPYKKKNPSWPGKGKKERLILPSAPPIVPTLPYAIIVDIDGTVAEMDGRGPFEWSKVGTDKPRKQVIYVVLATLKYCDQLIFVSGRDGECEEKTREWLDNNITSTYLLYMRPPSDMRRDSIVKREIHDNFIKGRYNVRAIFDDRPQVIRECWQALGYGDRIFNVGTGEEF